MLSRQKRYGYILGVLVTILDKLSFEGFGPGSDTPLF